MLEPDSGHGSETPDAGGEQSAESQRLRTAQRWALLNTLSTLLLIIWSGVAGAGIAFDDTVGTLSHRYDTSFTPADYAFGIWGLIYLSMLVLVARQLKLAFFDGKRDIGRVESILQLGAAFFVAQTLCGLWLLAWLSELIAASLAVMFGLWVALMFVVHRWNMERWDAPWSVIVTQWWPISLYAGWITVALLANLGAMLASLDVAFVDTAAWAIGLAALLVSFNLLMIFARNMREFSAVAVWALVAVASRHAGGPLQLVSFIATGGAILLAAAAGYHAYKNFTWPSQQRLKT